MFDIIVLSVLSVNVTLFAWTAAIITANTPRQSIRARLALIGLALINVGAMVLVVS